jgi:hypothetical protein
MKTAVKEYCWRQRTKPSPYIYGIIQEVIDFPEHFEGVAIPPAGGDNFSVWTDMDTWNRAIAVSVELNTRLSAMVRVAMARDLEEEGIPYHVSTVNPRNDYIPIRE